MSLSSLPVIDPFYIHKNGGSKSIESCPKARAFLTPEGQKPLSVKFCTWFLAYSNKNLVGRERVSVGSQRAPLVSFPLGSGFAPYTLCYLGLVWPLSGPVFPSQEGVDGSSAHGRTVNYKPRENMTSIRHTWVSRRQSLPLIPRVILGKPLNHQNLSALSSGMGQCYPTPKEAVEIK